MRLKQFGLISCLWVAHAIVGYAQSSSPDYILDIVTHPTTPERPGREGAHVGPGHASVTEGEDLTRGIRVTLESLDRRDYHRGDPLTYEILIENVGPSDVVLPWSPDRVGVQENARDIAGVRQVILSLSVTDRPGKPGALLEPVTSIYESLSERPHSQLARASSRAWEPVGASQA
jgi:hypothetical protein